MPRPAILSDSLGARRRRVAERPAGRIRPVESLIDDARRENVFGLLMSLSILIEFGDAFDFRGGYADAGFQRFATLQLNGTYSAAMAYL